MTRHLVHGALSAAAQRWPDKVAVRAEGRWLTYGQLDVAADRVSGRSPPWASAAATGSGCT